MSIGSLFALCFVVVLIALVVLVARGTRQRGKMGINLARTKCPRCGTLAPLFRKPTSLKQMLWGGWTCTNCGCEMDTWGREIPKPGGSV